MALAFVWTTVGLDGIGPASLGRVSARTGTPLPATLAAGAVATFTTLAAFAVAGDDKGRYFSAALSPSIALLAPANLVVFPALVRLRRSRPDQPRPFRVPGGPAGALAAALWPGLGTGDPDAHLPDGFAGDRLGFTLAELVPLAAVLAPSSLLARRAGAAQAPPAPGR